MLELGDRASIKPAVMKNGHVYHRERCAAGFDGTEEVISGGISAHGVAIGIVRRAVNRRQITRLIPVFIVLA